MVAAAAGFGLLEAVAAVMPGMLEFLPTIAVMGFVNLMFQAMANAYVQLAVDAELRGRVMGLYMLVFVGGSAFGAPIVGAVTSHFGARAGMATCGIVSALAALITGVALARWRRSAARKDAASRGCSIPVVDDLATAANPSRNLLVQL